MEIIKQTEETREISYRLDTNTFLQDLAHQFINQEIEFEVVYITAASLMDSQEEFNIYINNILPR